MLTKVSLKVRVSLNPYHRLRDPGGSLLLGAFPTGKEDDRTRRQLPAKHGDAHQKVTVLAPWSQAATATNTKKECSPSDLPRSMTFQQLN